MTPPLELALLPVALLAAGGIAALAASARPRLATALGAGAAVVACAAGLAGSLVHLRLGVSASWVSMPWRMPLAALVVGIDPLSAWFAVPMFGLGGLGAVYGTSVLARSKKSPGPAWFAYDLLLAGMAMLLLARNGVLFLVAWEVMSIAAWALVSSDHERPEVRRAGLVYLVAAHAGAAALIVLFLVLLRASGGSPTFTDLQGQAAPASALVLLALLGFGAKMGLVPFHVWLPEAHAAAPSHVSALMSGVLVKMGVYGLLRIVLVVGVPPWLGPVLLALGLTGALTGMGQAISQRDLKRALACSTIENVGLVAVGLGVGLVGLSAGKPALASLGLTAGLLHVWNHAAMKGLLFLGAGAILHGAGTRDLEALGGLLRRMPATGALVVAGALGLAGLPPTNGFVSEWLLAMGLMRAGGALSGGAGLALHLGLAVLAFVGTLAALALARVVGIALLGEPRSDAARHAHEAGAGMVVPMIALAVVCGALGLVPNVVVGWMGPLVHDLGGTAAVAEVAPLGRAAVAVWVALLGGAAAGALLLRRAPAGASGTWDCGYAAAVPRATYAARGFARLAADHLLPRPLRPSVRRDGPSDAPFPAPSRLELGYGDPLLERVYVPLASAWADRSSRLRRLQHGRTHLYVAYIGVFLATCLAFATWQTWVGP